MKCTSVEGRAGGSIDRTDGSTDWGGGTGCSGGSTVFSSWEQKRPPENFNPTNFGRDWHKETPKEGGERS